MKPGTDPKSNAEIATYNTLQVSVLPQGGTHCSQSGWQRVFSRLTSCFGDLSSHQRAPQEMCFNGVPSLLFHDFFLKTP